MCIEIRIWEDSKMSDKKSEVLERLSKALKSPLENNISFENDLGMAEDAYFEGDYDLADELLSALGY